MTQAEKEAVLSLRQQQYSFSAIAETIGLSRVGEKKESSVQASAPRVTLNHTCCRQCGSPLDQTQRGKTRTFCSDRCRAAYWNEHRDLSHRASAHKQTCEVCGRTFYTYQGRYCSRACYSFSVIPTLFCLIYQPIVNLPG